MRRRAKRKADGQEPFIASSKTARSRGSRTRRVRDHLALLSYAALGHALLFFNPTLRQYRKQALRDAAALLRQRITSVAERSIRSVKSWKGDRADAAATAAGILAVGSFLNAEV